MSWRGSEAVFCFLSSVSISSPFPSCKLGVRGGIVGEGRGGEGCRWSSRPKEGLQVLVSSAVSWMLRFFVPSAESREHSRGNETLGTCRGAIAPTVGRSCCCVGLVGEEIESWSGRSDGEIGSGSSNSASKVGTSYALGLWAAPSFDGLQQSQLPVLRRQLLAGLGLGTQAVEGNLGSLGRDH